METKKIIIIALLLFSNITFAQNIKLMDHFSYEQNGVFLSKWIKYDEDSSTSALVFFDKYKLSNVQTNFYPYPNNMSYNMNGRNKDTSGVIVLGIGNTNTHKMDDWMVYRVQLNVSPNDTIAFYGGAAVKDRNAPWGNNGYYKKDTIEVWLSDKQLTTEPSNMNIFVGYAIVNDTNPIWNRFEFKLSGLITANKLVYLGLRSFSNDFYNSKRNNAFWLDDVYVGNNPSRDLATKTEDLVVKASLKVYPNPAKDKLNIEFKNNAENGEIKVFNIFGQVVISQNVQVSVNGIHELNVETLPKGIYFLQYGSKNQKTVSSKFVKE